MNNDSVNIYVQLFVWLCFHCTWIYECIPRNEIGRSYGKSIFSNLSKCQAIFQSDWTIYISTSSEWVFHFFPCPCQQVLFSDFLIKGILVGVKWYLLVILISIFLMTNSFEHVFVCFFIICIFSWETCLFRSFTHFWIGLFVFFLLSSSYILDTSPFQICDLQIYFPILRVVLCF